MGPMTRNRCVNDYKHDPAQVKHYADRARDGTGLIVNEGTFPFMIDDQHASACKKVTGAVHEEGGKIFFKAWHAGRYQHDLMPIMKEKGGRALAPSSIKANAGKYRDLPGCPGHTDNIEAIKDPREIVGMYRRTVMLAKDAGFDGVELLAHGHANKQTDTYGGSVGNRCRFVLELVDTISDINPTDSLNDSAISFKEMKETYTYLINELVAREVGIINIGRRGANPKGGTGDFFGYTGRPNDLPLPPGYDSVLGFGRLVKFPRKAETLVDEGKLDLITFARPFIYNPDIIFWIKHGVPFTANDRGNTVYYGPYATPDENYNDWPAAAV
ncbi:hypothetical protein BDW69DRAFT_192499 [Aspergillus filifer]